MKEQRPVRFDLQVVQDRLHRQSAGILPCLPRSHLPPVNLEGFVELDGSLRDVAVEGQSEEGLRGDVFVDETFYISESEARVVARVAHEAAASGVQGLQARQALLDQRPADALPLLLRQDGHGAQAVPVRRTVGKRYRREGEEEKGTGYFFGVE